MQSVFATTDRNEQFESLSREEQKTAARSMESARRTIRDCYDGDTFDQAFDRLKAGDSIKTIEGFDPSDREPLESARETFLTNRDRLVLSCVRLIIHESYADSSQIPSSRKELEAEGMYHMVRAAEQYDPDEPTKFSTYALYHFLRAKEVTLETFRTCTRIPQYLIQDEREYRKGVRKLNQQDRPVTIDNLQTVTNLTESAIQRVQSIPNVTSLMTSRNTMNGEGVSEAVIKNNSTPPDERFADKRVQSLLEEFAAELNDRKQTVFYEYMLNEETTLKGVADKIDCCRERVRQLKETIKDQIKNWEQADALNELYDMAV